MLKPVEASGPLFDGRRAAPPPPPEPAGCLVCDARPAMFLDGDGFRYCRTHLPPGYFAHRDADAARRRAARGRG